jgi:hypothetical protein
MNGVAPLGDGHHMVWCGYQQGNAPFGHTITSIANVVAGSVISADNLLFWLDVRSGSGALYGYDFVEQREFLIKESVWNIDELTSDRNMVAWIQYGAPQFHVQGYDLQTQQETTIFTSTVRHLRGQIALADGVLYYADTAPGHWGIYARDLTTGQEQQITSGERTTEIVDLVVKDGFVLWGEHEGRGWTAPPHATLYMNDLNRGTGQTVVAQGEDMSGGLVGFDIDGDSIVYAFALESQVWHATISSGARQPIPVQRDADTDTSLMIARPLIHGNRIIWNTQHVPPVPHPILHSVDAYDITTGEQHSIIEPGQEYVQSWTTTVSDTLLFTAAAQPPGPHTLYTTGVNTEGLTVTRAISDPGATVAQFAPGEHVQIEGNQFKLDSETWQASGVHFLLPQYGINGRTFGENQYRSANLYVIPREVEERNAWLQIAQQMGVRTLRIFVDPPGEFAPAFYTELYRFARDAEEYGMRLGIVVHNSGDFSDLTGAKIRWIGDLVDCFAGRLSFQCGAEEGRDDTYLIAYISADNEINNHPFREGEAIPGNPNCTPLPDDRAVDCYKQPDAEASRRYIIDAHAWVRAVRDAVKERDPDILVTVGMATNYTDQNGTILVSVDNYFRDGGDEYEPLWQAGRTDNLVDFIAPHHYGSFFLQEKLINEIPADYRSARPTMLEEFGYYTDPQQQNPDSYYDGPRSCRDNPGSCGTNAAPVILERHSLTALRAGDFDTGIAFMLADVTDKNDTSRPCGPPEAQPWRSPDLYTGLFTIDSSYDCGGTENNGLAQIKNTGYQVCQYYGGSDCTLDPAPFPSSSPCPATTSQGFPHLCVNQVYLPLVER